MIGRNLGAALFVLLHVSFVLCRTTQHPSMESKRTPGELQKDVSIQTITSSQMLKILSIVDPTSISESNIVTNSQSSSSAESKIQRSFKLASYPGNNETDILDGETLKRIDAMRTLLLSPVAFSNNPGKDGKDALETKKFKKMDSLEALLSPVVFSGIPGINGKDALEKENLKKRDPLEALLSPVIFSVNPGNNETDNLENFKHVDTVEALLAPIMFSGNPDEMLYESYEEGKKSDASYLKNGLLIFLGALISLFILSFVIKYVIDIGNKIRTGHVLSRENSHSNEIQQPEQPDSTYAMVSPVSSAVISPCTQSHQTVPVSPTYNKPHLSRNSFKIGLPKIKPGLILSDKNSPPGEIEQINRVSLEQPSSAHGSAEHSHKDLSVQYQSVYPVHQSGQLNEVQKPHAVTLIQSPMPSALILPPSQPYQPVLASPTIYESSLSRNSFKIGLPKIKPGLILSGSNSPTGEFEQQNPSKIQQGPFPHGCTEQPREALSPQYQPHPPVHLSGQHPPTQMGILQPPPVVEFQNHLSTQTPNIQSPTQVEQPSPVLEFHNHMSE